MVKSRLEDIRDTWALSICCRRVGRYLPAQVGSYLPVVRWRALCNRSGGCFWFLPVLKLYSSPVALVSISNTFPFWPKIIRFHFHLISTLCSEDMRLFDVSIWMCHGLFGRRHHLSVELGESGWWLGLDCTPGSFLPGEVLR